MRAEGRFRKELALLLCGVQAREPRAGREASARHGRRTGEARSGRRLCRRRAARLAANGAVAVSRTVWNYTEVPIVFRDPDALAQAVTQRLAAPAVIGVDGWIGVGKTTLANQLAHRTNGSSYDLDSALQRDLGRYTTALRLDEIKKALNQPETLLFVSGICLRQVLSEVGRPAVAHIYVKRMATWGWADEDELTLGKIPEISGASGGQVRKELRSYHQRWRPHLCADFEFQLAS